SVVWITDVVRKEITAELPDWIQITTDYDVAASNTLQPELGPGEATAIVLAQKFENALLIIDERKGRKSAAQLGLKCVGLVGILLAAKEREYIQNGPTIVEGLEIHGFWLASSLRAKLYKALTEVEKK
ncbi:MAG: DUF3368 domain-containing protein, partial [Bacteroidota bacterium]